MRLPCLGNAGSDRSKGNLCLAIYGKLFGVGIIFESIQVGGSSSLISDFPMTKLAYISIFIYRSLAAEGISVKEHQAVAPLFPHSLLLSPLTHLYIYLNVSRFATTIPSTLKWAVIRHVRWSLLGWVCLSVTPRIIYYVSRISCHPFPQGFCSILFSKNLAYTSLPPLISSLSPHITYV